MIEKQIINLLLEKDLYEENKGRVSKSMFTNGTGKLYETIQKHIQILSLILVLMN